MSSIFLGPKPWPRISALARSHTGSVAVPFIGQGAARQLPLRPGSVLVTRLDEASVKQGVVHPGEVLKYIRSGVEVHAHNALHAKVYVFGRRAVVGSANVSASSASLTEACLETADPVAVAAAREFVLKLRSVPVGPEMVKALVPLFPEAKARAGNGRARNASGPRLFIVPVHESDWDEGMLRADSRGTERAARKLRDTSSHRLDKVAVGKRDVRAMQRGDIIVFRWSAGRGFAFDPPGQFLHAETHARGALVYIEVKKRQRQRTSAAVRQALGAEADSVVYPASTVRQVRKPAVAQSLLSLWLAR